MLEAEGLPEIRFEFLFQFLAQCRGKPLSLRSVFAMIVPMPKKILLLLCLMLPEMQAFAQPACQQPASPAIPSGRTSTQKEMRETMEAVKAFIGAGVAYRECLEKQFSGAKDDLPERARVVLEEAYQDSLEMDELVAHTFNTQLRIFKSLND